MEEQADIERRIAAAFPDEWWDWSVWDLAARIRAEIFPMVHLPSPASVDEGGPDGERAGEGL